MNVAISSIAGHGKGEVDHVGGLSKVTIRRAIAGGQLIKKIDEMVDYMESKFSDKTYPRYVFRDISPIILEDKRMEDRLKKYRTIDGSSRFQVAVFHHGKTTFRAAPYLCICDQCMDNKYGSCCTFEEHGIVVTNLNIVALHTSVDETNCETESDLILDFAQVGSIVAIPASSKATETVYFLKLVSQSTNGSPMI